MDLQKLDPPLTEIESQLKVLVDEAHGLRFKPDESSINLDISSPKIILDSLLACRARLDRLEELLAIATRARGRAWRAHQEAARLAQEAWDATSAASRTGPSRRSEYTGAKEHYADNNLATIDEKRTAYRAERLADYADECYRVIKILYHGLDNYRADHLVIIRALSFESHLERTTTDKGY